MDLTMPQYSPSLVGADNIHQTEPVFRNLTEALLFAFRYSSGKFPESMLSKLYASPGLGTGKELVGLDGAAQAGMILATVERLDATQRAAIIARFAPRFEECRCCGGDKPRREWDEAINRLAAWAIPSGVSHMRVRRMLVGKHFGVRGVEYTAIADQYGLSRKKVAETFREVTKRLSSAEMLAQDALEDEFKKKGLVP